MHHAYTVSSSTVFIEQKLSFVYYRMIKVLFNRYNLLITILNRKIVRFLSILKCKLVIIKKKLCFLVVV